MDRISRNLKSEWAGECSERREHLLDKLFSLDEIPGGVYLHIHAFGDVKVYLNGNLLVDKKPQSKALRGCQHK